MGLASTLGTILQTLKGACFNVVAVLTVLVAVGNELRRWPMVFGWLEGRQVLLRRAWYVALGLFVVLAVLYAYVEHNPGSLVVDLASVVLMVGAVLYLQHRRELGGGKKDSEPERKVEPLPRRPLQGERRYRRVPRRRREPDLDEVPDDAEE